MTELVVLSPQALTDLCSTAFRAVLDETQVKSSPWMDAREAAEYLRTSYDAVRKMASDGTIPYRKMGKYLRFNREELDRWLDST